MVWDRVLTNQITDGLEQDQALRLVPDQETRLIEAAQYGDLSAFNLLVLAYQDDLYGWAASLVKDEALADDITQQTLITAYQKIGDFRGGSLRAWLFRIARNRSIDHIRRQRSHPAVSLDDDPRDEDAGDLLSMLTANDLPPEEAVIQAEQAEWIQRMLDSLPEAYRQVLRLVDLYEMDYQEAAGVLGLPLGTLKSRLARARLKLRDLVTYRLEPA